MTVQATGANLYTQQLARHAQARQAALESERRHHLLRNAQQAAFVSLMRGKGFSVYGTLPTAAPPAATTPPTPPPALTESFERLVAGALAEHAGGRLDFAARHRLADQAEAMGLTRFDANLLIARVGYYAGAGRSAAAARGTGTGSRKRPPKRIYRWATIVLSLLLLQTALVLLWVRFLQAS